MAPSSEDRATWTAADGAAPPAPPSGPFQPGTVLGDRFRLDRFLGGGGAGSVYAAFDLAAGRAVAVKVIHPHLMGEETRVRLQREVQAAHGGHRALLTVHDLHHVEGVWLLSMELVEGVSLREWVRQRGRLEVEEVVSVGQQVAEALADLHRRGLLHRDVKPGNILLRPDGSAVLCDLGLARPLDHGMTVTQQSAQVGTPAYMAPEQVLFGETSDRVDVYGLGLTLVECLAGSAPLTSSTPVSTALKRQGSRPPRCRAARADCPLWLDRLLAWMLEPAPASRPDAARVAAAFAARRVAARLRRATALRLAAVLLVTAAGVAGGRWLWLERTVGVEALDRTVRGVDRRGDATWSLQLSSPIRVVERADLTGDGVEEVAVVAYPDEPPGGLTAGVEMSEVLVVSRRGRVVTRVRPEELTTGWHHPFARRFSPSLTLADLDRDGVLELLVSCRHRNFYPDQLLVYWTRSGQWDWVLDHSGYLFDVVPVPDSEPPALRFLGVNNRLAMLPVVGEVQLLPPPQRRATLQTENRLVVGMGSSGFGRSSTLSLYLPLEPGVIVGCSRRVELAVTADGGTRISCGDDTDLDRFGNPTPGPNAGRDLRQMRLELMAGLERLLATGQAPREPEPVARSLRELEVRAAPLLAERPYRAAVGLAGALALAGAGDLAGARARLESTAAEAPFDDVLYRLAHLEALAGDTAAAADRTLRVAREGTSGRAGYDAPHLLLRLAAERRDLRLLGLAVEALSSRGATVETQPGLVSTLTGRAKLWWDTPGEGDLAVRSWPYAPWGDAVACLARWRAGRLQGDDGARMRHLVATVPEAAAEGRLALVAVLLERGDSAGAMAEVEAAMAILEPEARTDFFSRQLLDLAQGLRATALERSGQPGEARTAAEALLARAAPGLLPANLAGEVLRATQPDASQR